MARRSRMVAHVKILSQLSRGKTEKNRGAQIFLAGRYMKQVGASRASVLH
jgi:hypothetical protein